jgi:hypothetical protein
MKTLILAVRCSLMFTAVAAFSLAHPASVQAGTTYQYTGNPFTFVSGPYTTSDFVTAMVTLARPLPPNSFGSYAPIDFRITDGVQTMVFIAPNNPPVQFFFFSTNATGAIIRWHVEVANAGGMIETNNSATGLHDFAFTPEGVGVNFRRPGIWTRLPLPPVPDAGSTLSLMTLTLMALGLVARRF